MAQLLAMPLRIIRYKPHAGGFQQNAIFLVGDVPGRVVLPATHFGIELVMDLARIIPMVHALTQSVYWRMKLKIAILALATFIALC